MRRKKKRLANEYTVINQVKLLRAGSSYFNVLLNLIDNATENIYIQTYIFDDDETGRQVASALKEAVKRKVNVYVMADGYASQPLSSSFVEEIASAGINFRFFESLLKSRNFYFGRRLHHKIAVFDARYALVGGINISNRYNDLPEKPAWLDFALYVEGEIAKQLCDFCLTFWNGYHYKNNLITCPSKPISFFFLSENQSKVRMRRNDWVYRKNEISATYVEMLRNAQSHVTILCSYFLPGKVIRKQMSQAIKRGVTVRVIAAGRSDVMLAKYAERWLYDWLLRRGLELYEYQKNILHGKIAVCDDEWMTIGSYNINNISAYASIELNLDVLNPAFAGEVRELLEQIIANDCIRITYEHHIKTRSIFTQLSRWLSYQFIRMLFYIFTFYFKHRN